MQLIPSIRTPIVRCLDFGDERAEPVVRDAVVEGKHTQHALRDLCAQCDQSRSGLLRCGSLREYLR